MDRPVVAFNSGGDAESGAATVAERLERGALLTFPSCPFPLPEGDERAWLLGRRLQQGQLSIRYEPQLQRAVGFVPQTPADAERLRGLLVQSGEQATRWLGELAPQYAATGELEQSAFHPEEEATRKLRPVERNDVLHVDVPARPTLGRRLLRLFVNLHPTDARVWLTSLPFAELIKRYGAEIGLPAPDQKLGWGPLRHRLLQLFQGRHGAASPLDDFLPRLHDFLKQHDLFQERSPKKCWRFPPGSAWLAFTDGLSHAELRGRFILEHSWFISHDSLVCPDLSPRSLLERACGAAAQVRAA